MDKKQRNLETIKKEGTPYEAPSSLYLTGIERLFYKYRFAETNLFEIFHLGFGITNNYIIHL